MEGAQDSANSIPLRCKLTNLEPSSYIRPSHPRTTPGKGTTPGAQSPVKLFKLANSHCSPCPALLNKDSGLNLPLTPLHFVTRPGIPLWPCVRSMPPVSRGSVTLNPSFNGIDLLVSSLGHLGKSRRGHNIHGCGQVT